MTTLSDLCLPGGVQTGPFGSQLHAEEYSSHGVPVVMPQDIGDNRIEVDAIARVPEDVAVRLARHRLKPGDIVYSRRGDVERRAWVSDNQNGWLCGTGCLRVRVNPSLADSRFVSYYLGTSESRSWIVSHAVGATMLNLNTSILAAVPMTVPSIDLQRSIAEVLGALDDKIAANSKLADAADRVLSALYQAVLAGAEGDEPLADLVSTQYGITISPEGSGHYRLARVTDINKKPWIEWDGAPSCAPTPSDVKKYGLSPRDVVVARMADPGKVGIVDEDAPPAVFASYLVRVRPGPSLEPLFLYYFFRSPSYADYSLASRGGSVQSNMNARVIVGASIPRVPLDRQAAFAADAGVLRARLSAAIRESSRLATLRDALLAHLMSGRISVREAKKAVEEVL